VTGVFFHVFGQVDNSDSVERTFLDAQTASDAKVLGDFGHLVGALDFDAEFSGFVDRTDLLALLLALLGLAPVLV
jgi:hypothetical protein